MSRSKKWHLEWELFLGSNGRRQYNPLCKACARGCKQSSQAKVIVCPRYLSKRSKRCMDKG